MITSSMRSPQPPALLCNLCFVTFLECSKSNSMFLKVLAKNLDCEKKKSQKVLLRVAPPCNFHKQLFSSHKMFDKKRLITTRHRGKHFCSRSFWASNFFCKQGNLQNWCWQQDVLNEAMNSASFLEFIFFFCYSIWVFCVAQPLWPWLKPSAAQVLSEIV